MARSSHFRHFYRMDRRLYFGIVAYYGNAGFPWERGIFDNAGFLWDRGILYERGLSLGSRHIMGTWAFFWGRGIPWERGLFLLG